MTNTTLSIRIPKAMSEALKERERLTDVPVSRFVRRAIADGYVLVTNNAMDFMALLRREKVHAGLVCINVAHGLMSLDVQKRLFALALDRLADHEPINELLEITLNESRSVQVERYEFPATK